MRSSIDAALWPLARAEEALHELARAAGMAPRSPRAVFATGLESTLETAADVAADEAGEPARQRADLGELDARLASSAAEMDLEIEHVDATHARAAELLRGAGPALVRLESAVEGGVPRLAALLRTRGARARLLAPDGACVEVDVDALRARWCAQVESVLAQRIEPVLDAAGIKAARRDRARAALVDEQLAHEIVGGAFLVRLPPGRPLVAQARRAGLGWRLGGIAVASALASALTLAAWIALGRGALDGRFEPGWIAAWVLLLATTLPLRWWEGLASAEFALRLGALLKRRLLAGAARLDPRDVRGEGSGALLGRVLASEALESLALGGGFLLLGATIDVLLATWALSHAPDATLALTLLGAAALAALVLGVRQARRAREFADARRTLTQDLVERMVGHRTRVAQESPQSWHVEEDRLLGEYVVSARRLDRSTLALSAGVGATFGLAGLAALGVAYVAGATDPAALAIGVGGVLLGQQALAKLAEGLAQLATCLAAWKQVAPLYAAAAREEEHGLARSALRPMPPRSGTPLVCARAATFEHGSRGRAALDHADFEIARGEHVLVEGPSGGGKSTLASLLIGWRTPTSGVLLLGGLDRRAWGAAGWRARVGAAPQFHENRVFTASLAFNLLLGARADEGDAAEERRAVEVCEELGLGDLLKRMPAGVRQLLGETGWQLSHGEKSRVFVARALLARADLVVLDESLAGLDPHSARTVLDTVLRRAPALVVIAHP